MSRQRKNAIINPRKKSKLLTSTLTNKPHVKIKAIIRSTSMLPLLVPGMEVILDSEIPRCGDIVCFYDKDKKIIIAHRVLSINQGAEIMVVKGDNRPYAEKINSLDVIGRIEVLTVKGRKINLNKFPYNMINFILYTLSKITYRFPGLTPLIRGRRFLVKLFIR